MTTYESDGLESSVPTGESTDHQPDSELVYASDRLIVSVEIGEHGDARLVVDYDRTDGIVAYLPVHVRDDLARALRTEQSG